MQTEWIKFLIVKKKYLKMKGKEIFFYIKLENVIPEIENTSIVKKWE